MFEKCSGLTSLDISNFYPNSNENYKRMFFGCTNLEYVNFYNYYENENTIYNDIITEAHSQIKLCIHVKREARIYQSHSTHLLIECIRPDVDPTTIVTTSVPTEKATTAVTKSSSTEKIEKEASSETTNNETSEKETIKQTQQLSDIQPTINEENNNILSSNQKEKYESKSSINPINSYSINSNDIINNVIIASEYTIIDDVIHLFHINNNTQVYNFINDYMMQDFNGVNGQKIYIKGVNDFIFEITTELNEKELLNTNIRSRLNSSIIDLGECSNLLKNRYFPNNNNVSLIILKFEKMTNISSEKNIQFEVYDPFNFTKLDISICQNISIDIYIPTQLSERTENLIEYIEKLGYNVFNLNSPFYTDFCTPFTIPEGTDMTLADRKKYIYEAVMNEVNCQENCDFSSYDEENRYLECSCKVQEEINTVDYKKFDLKKMYQTFYDVLKYSNYKVILCYKLVFSLKNFDFNKGRWIIFILFILYLTQLFIYL